MLDFFWATDSSPCSPVLVLKAGFELRLAPSLPSIALSTLYSAFLIAAAPFFPFGTCRSTYLNIIGKLPSGYW